MWIVALLFAGFTAAPVLMASGNLGGDAGLGLRTAPAPSAPASSVWLRRRGAASVTELMVNLPTHIANVVTVRHELIGIIRSPLKELRSEHLRRPLDIRF